LNLANQTYNQSNQSIELVNKSGLIHIDSLFNNRYGQPIRWISDPTIIKKEGLTKITYSFPGLNGNNLLFNYEDDRGKINASAFTTKQAEDIRKIFSNISKFINIEFIEIQEVGDNVGTIRLALNTITDEAGVHRPGIVATGDPPAEEERGGDVWFNINFNNSNFSDGLVIGSQTGVGDVTVMMHEIFHALGLEHPDDNEDFPEDKNSREFTLMAGEFKKEGGAEYIKNNQSYVVASTPMIYDIAPLQYLYGANTLHNYDDTYYSYDPKIPFIETIWDGGGSDTLDLSNFNKKNILNLEDGQSSTIGFDVNWSMDNNLGIAFNAIIENARGGSGADQITGNKYKNNIQGNGGDDIIDGGSDYDIATYSGNFSDYTFIISNKKVTVTDNRVSTNDGTDTLSNIEKLIFADKNALITSKEVKGITSLGFKSEKVYSGKSDTYKFYDLGSDNYGVETSTGIDELTGASILKFDDKNMHLVKDIKATFDQVTGMNTDSGKMFRLYNASFKRLPDPDGLRYWILNFSSGKDDERAVASSFLASDEFKQRYGENVTNESYVNTLYKNVLERDADTGGLNYWLGQLNSGAETRYEVLLGFAESAENKALFTEITGFS